MPVIKPRTTQKQRVRHISSLYRENNETLFAYAIFIDESPEYVLNQLIETVLAKDREFTAWRETHPGSHVPTPGTRKRPGRRAFPSSEAAHASASGAAASRT